MAAIDPIDTAAPEGLRARKKRQTRERIARAAIRLFLERGFDATTLDAIVAAADVARRTFFHYFESKEAILDTIEEGADAILRDALSAAPQDQPPFAAVRAAMLAMVSAYDADEARALSHLMRSTDALRARTQANYIRKERLVFAALTEKWPDPHLRLKLRLVALVGIGALRLAAEAWDEETWDEETWDEEADGRPLQDHLRGVLSAIGDDITA